MNNMITTCHLTKKYKSFTAVNDVSLHIQKGRIYGFLGPNGAGKSTTMKMLLGLTAPTKGSFTINGKHFPDDRLEILKGIGSLIEAPSFYANLTGRENLDIIRRILDLPKHAVDDALALVGLTEFENRLAKKEHRATRRGRPCSLYFGIIRAESPLCQRFASDRAGFFANFMSYSKMDGFEKNDFVQFLYHEHLCSYGEQKRLAAHSGTR